MPFIRHGDKAENVRRLYALFWKYQEKLTEVKGIDQLSISCLEPPCYKFYLVRDAEEGWCSLDFERRQRMTARKRRFAG